MSSNPQIAQNHYELVGQGTSAKVFAVDEHTVVKIYTSLKGSSKGNMQEYLNATKITALINQGTLSERYARLLQAVKNTRTEMYEFYMERYKSDLEKELAHPLSEEPTQQEKITAWIGQALLATIELHQKTNCIHGDLNPKNILITKQGKAHLGDWECLEPATIRQQAEEIRNFADQLFDEAYGHCDGKPKKWLKDLLAPFKDIHRNYTTEDWSHNTLVQFVKLFVPAIPKSDGLATCVKSCST